MTIHSGADAPIVSNDANETPKRGRIDLTKDGLRKAIREHEERYYEPSIEDVETTLNCLGGIGLIAELKRMYAREDMLLVALRIIRNDLNEALDGPLNFLLNGYNDWSEVIEKIRNFANDASQ